MILRNIFSFSVGLLLLSCSLSPPKTEVESMDLHLGRSNYKEAVDFLYSFAREYRLNVSWLGWYHVDNPQHWYERSDRESNFKIKLELLDEGNGYIFVASEPTSDVADLVIDYGDKKPVWLQVIKAFKKEVAKKGWRMEALHK